jgi:arylsulfatase A-like enzyme
VEPEPYFSKYDPAAMPVPKLPANARQVRAAQTGRGKRAFIDDEQMMRRMTALYYGAIAHIDDQIGRIFRELDALGMADQTLVLFTADHGNMLGDHGRWFKGVQYEGSAHVPLLWKGPKGSPENGGRVVEKVVENTDLVPSILESVNVPVPDGVQGRSFVKLAGGKDNQWKDRCYSQLRSGMLLEEGWKFIDNSLDGSGTRELYNLRNDPMEERNLAADPRHRGRAEAYLQKLTKWRADRPEPVRISGMSTPAYAQISDKEREEAVRVAPENAARAAERTRNQK